MKWYKRIRRVFICVLLISCYHSNGDNESSFYSEGVLSYRIENEVVGRYLDLVTYDSDYSYSYVSDFCNSQTDYRKDYSNSVKISWEGKRQNQESKTFSPKGRFITINDKESFYRRIQLSLEQDDYEFCNLSPNVIYYVTVTDSLNESSERLLTEQRITLLGQLRMVSIDGLGVSNIRDLGGWKTQNGGHVKYGKLFRGGEVFRDDGKRDIKISGLGIKQLTEDLGVNVELDFGDFSSYSPLEKYGIEFFHGTSYQISAYMKGLEKEKRRIQYRNCLMLIINELSKGKTLYFHCNAGADRTGTLAFLLEGLLGVSESDLSKDYELTSFSLFGEKKRTNESFIEMISFIKENYEGISLNEKLYTMAVTPVDAGGLGIPEEDIYLLRHLLIEL